ncbi:MAG TPA: prolyl oligopeptidase family serine peptidase, partial [Mucilaginibacter sp.]|nr:prolyl oligopeptidase family serine peptidase [Mucilaginibacter sp.]
KMLNRIKTIFPLIVIIVFCSCRNHRARLIPISDFFKNPEEVIFRISPDGKYVSYLKSYKGKLNLFIRSLPDGRECMATAFTDYSVRDYSWTYNNQIVFSQDVIALDQYKMYVLDVLTLKTRNILSLDKGRIRLISNRFENDPDVITIAMNKRDPANFDIYKLNIRTGALHPYLVNPGNITEWYPDDDGRIRLVKSSDGVDETILYRPDDNSPFRPIIRNNFKTRVEPIAFTGKNSDFYALSNANQDKTAIVVINAENGKEGKTLFKCDKADIDRVDYSVNKHRLESAVCEEEKPKKNFLNPDEEKLYKNLWKQLHASEINIVGRDTAEDKCIVFTYSDKNPGTYYLYETGSQKLIKLGDINSSLHPSELCAMKPISFKARDGLLINGYLTLPQGSKTINLPVVVMPHDGPWRSRDNWHYSDEVQFLANRGYAVFQVNYRGSTGYGKAFFSAGLKQAGGKIQDDITDGVHWLIDQHIANPKKIAIFGAGFGGFSALYGVSFHPDLYNCAIVQYGLINFFTYIKDVPPYFKPRLQMLYQMIGNPETDAEELRAISPVFHTDKIKAPLLIFQGAKDESANISELNQFVRELKKQNVPVTYFLKPNERKYFRNEHNRMEMYAEIEKFLNENMRVKR